MILNYSSTWTISLILCLSYHRLEGPCKTLTFHALGLFTYVVVHQLERVGAVNGILTVGGVRSRAGNYMAFTVPTMVCRLQSSIR